MPVVHREHGLNFVVFVDDHPPAHVHITGRATARIALEPTVHVTDNRGLSKADIGRALKVVRAQRELMLEAWVKIHG